MANEQRTSKPLVQRLREDSTWPSALHLCREAADEIESLQERVNDLLAQLAEKIIGDGSDAPQFHTNEEGDIDFGPIAPDEPSARHIPGNHASAAGDSVPPAEWEAGTKTWRTYPDGPRGFAPTSTWRPPGARPTPDQFKRLFDSLDAGICDEQTVMDWLAWVGLQCEPTADAQVLARLAWSEFVRREIPLDERERAVAELIQGFIDARSAPPPPSAPKFKFVCQHGREICEPCASAGASQPPGVTDRQRLEHYWKFCNVLTHPSYMDFQDWLKALDEDRAERCPTATKGAG